MNDARQPLQKRSFAGFAWSVLAYNMIVILWGAVVRATGSGAGCGEHWPLCQGVVIPHAAQIATLIEFAHRCSSGVAVTLVLGLAFLAFRRFGSGHPARRYSAAAVFFTLTEGLIGAALVLLGQVGSNASITHGLILSLHLVNTFLLLASLTLSAKTASVAMPTHSHGPETPDRPSDRVTGDYIWYGAGLLGTLALAVTGTIAALADTRFKATSLTQALRWDFSGSSAALLHIRVVHPFIAVAVGAFLIMLTLRSLRPGSCRSAKLLAKCLLALILFQFVFGLFNVLLLTPLWIQILHLLTADLMWIMLVLLVAANRLANASVLPSLRARQPGSSMIPASLSRFALTGLRIVRPLPNSGRSIAQSQTCAGTKQQARL
jgi:heme A synthase